MEFVQYKQVADEICEFLTEYLIEYTSHGVDIEAEWTDFRFSIKDEKQMVRIRTWLQSELKTAITTWTDIQISAPVPVSGKEQELRVRIYEH